MQLDGGQGIEVSHYFSNDGDTSSHAEPSNKSDKSLEDPVVPEKQPHTQAHMGDIEKPEPQPAFSVGDCWSDPCLDSTDKKKVIELNKTNYFVLKIIIKLHR